MTWNNSSIFCVNRIRRATHLSGPAYSNRHVLNNKANPKQLYNDISTINIYVRYIRFYRPAVSIDADPPVYSPPKASVPPPTILW